MIGEPLPGFCTVNEAAEELGLSREGVHRLIKRREISPVYYLGESYVIPLEAIAELYPPRMNVKLTDVADMLSALADGGIILSKALDEPRALAAQINLYREFVRALFPGAPTQA